MTATATLVPAYIDYGEQIGLDVGNAQAALATQHLRLPGGWSVMNAYRVDATVGFVESDAVPAWVGAVAMLGSDSTLQPRVVTRAVIPMLYVFVGDGTSSFQLELSDVRSPLASAWKSSLLARSSLVPTPLGGASVEGFGFVVDLGDALLRALYIPPLDDASDSFARVETAQTASAALLADLTAE